MTTLSTNAGTLARKNIDRQKLLRMELERARRESQKAIKRTAEALSSGTTSTATLSAPPPGLNHPYGYGGYNSRGIRGPVPNGGELGIINEQTGLFRNSWEADGYSFPDRQVITLWNDAPYAADMLGTDKMRARPILNIIRQREYPAFVRRFEEAKRRALAK